MRCLYNALIQRAFLPNNKLERRKNQTWHVASVNGLEDRDAWLL